MAYYTKYYWPTYAAPDTDASDLMSAIKAQLVGTPIAEALGDRFYYEAASRSIQYPYMLIKDGGSSMILKTSTSTIQDTTMKFQIYDETIDDASVIASAVELFWKNTTVQFTQGWTGPWDAGDRRTIKDGILSMDGQDVYYVQSEFRFKVKRSGA